MFASKNPAVVLRGFVLFARARCTFEGKGLHHSWLGGLKFEFIEKSIKGAKLDEDYDTYCRWKKSGDHQLRLVVYPIVSKVLYIPGGAGFLPSTVVHECTWNYEKQ